MNYLTMNMYEMLLEPKFSSFCSNWMVSVVRYT